MRLLALATGLLLLAVAGGIDRELSPRVPESRLWLTLLDAGAEGAGESVLTTRDRPRDKTAEFAESHYNPMD